MDQEKTLELAEQSESAEQAKTLELAKKKKKSIRNAIISAVAFAFVTIVLFSAQTYAYFTSGVNNDKNEIVSGNLDIELIELKNTDQGETTYINPVEIMPATSVSKIVKIKNAGNLPVYVRIKIEKTINKPADSLPTRWEDLISCDFDLDDVTTPEVEGLWIYQDGYYYYNMPLEPGSATVPLFENVYFSADMGNAFMDSEIYFTVRCEATQSNGNANTAMEAIGWPPESAND
ncbi:MAG: hypothetical protein E7590_02170 [Ruminococcaceae bacterium]|nr:hypothetical protein [Oscillospiraceae bacterium]